MHARDDQLLTDGIAQIGLAPSTDSVDRLRRYLDEVTMWNTRLSLVSGDGSDLVVRHVLDSLVIVPIIRSELQHLMAVHDRPIVIADLGSGAGLPGIPVACLVPEAPIVLIERSGKRVGFLRNAVAAANLKNVTIVDRDLSQTDTQFDLALMRAFRPLSAGLVATIISHMSGPGTLLACKGKRETLDGELAGMRAELSLGIYSEAVASTDVLPVEVPFLAEERHIVRLRFGSVTDRGDRHGRGHGERRQG